MKKIVRMLVSVATVSVMIIMFATPSFAGPTVTKKDGNTTWLVEYDNRNAQNYSVNPDNARSYVTETTSGYMIVNHDETDSVSKKSGDILIAYYDKNFKFKKSVTIKGELPLFGCFYTDGKNYYILSGAANGKKSDSVEVLRVTKYDKNWKVVARCAIKGVGATGPFASGSAAITSDDTYLYIETCSQRYDGHQSNFSFIVNKKTMKHVTDWKTIGVNRTALCGHSYNQFILMDGKNPVTVNHGDYNPRSVLLCKVGIGNEENQSINMYTYPRIDHYQWTGCSVGGFEMSDSTYIVVGNTVKQDKNYENNVTRNIFVSTVRRELNGTINKVEASKKVTQLQLVRDKDGKLVVGTKKNANGDVVSDEESAAARAEANKGRTKDEANVTTKMITNYKEGKGMCSTPQLVKLGDNSFLLMWAYTSYQPDGGYGETYYANKFNTIYYTKLNGKGEQVGKVYKASGYLSDCQPIVNKSGNVVWYTRVEKQVTFYTINTSKMTFKATAAGTKTTTK